MSGLWYISGLVVAIGLGYLWTTPTTSNNNAISLEDVDVHPLLQASENALGSPKITEVAENVYVATAFSFSTVTMVVGDDGVIIVDTTDSIEPAKRINEQFRKITNKPTKLIIYSHHHPDHVNGAKAFVTPGAPPPEVWAHERMPKEESLTQPVAEIFTKRGAFQLGLFVEDKCICKALYGDGNVRNVFFGKPEQLGKIPPTKLVKEGFNCTIAGIDFSVMHLPSETSDQIAVWIPKTRVLIAAGSLYKLFPNLYAIRGTFRRDVTDWINTLGKIIQLRPRVLIVGHSKPVSGEEKLQTILTNYRAGIQFVHDQTVRYMNKGMHPDEIAKTVKLHREFDDDPYFWQVYGTVPWSVKGIFHMYLGWFSGNAEELNPLTPKERAQRMIDLFGKDKLMSAAKSAWERHDYQWALELVSHVFNVEPSNERAITLRRAILKKQAGLMTSVNGRHYLMSVVLSDAGQLPKSINEKVRSRLPAATMLQRMRYMLNAEAVPVGEKIDGCFHLTDSKTALCLRLFKSVITTVPGELDRWDFKISLNENAFKKILQDIGKVPLPALDRYDGVTVEGNVHKLERFFSYIDMN